jgi:hypothetical protein
MRKLLTLIAIAVILGGCGTPDSGSFEPKESKPAQKQEKATDQQLQAPASPVVGEGMDAGDFEFRVLDVTRDKSWFYPETEEGFGSQAESMSGEFVTVWYSVRNTGVQPMSLNPGAKLTADSGESFALAEDAQCDDLGRIQPRGLQLGCFVFDVPTDVEPESVWVSFRRGNLAPETFDLTEANLENIGPDETLALHYELGNVGYFYLTYD